MRFLFALALCCTSVSAQDFKDYNIERVALNQRFTEGPVWTADNILVFSDTPNNKLMRWVPNEGVQLHRDNTPGASGNAVDAQGRLYVCESGSRRVIRIDKRNRVEVLAEKWEGKRLNAPNDIVVRKDGHVWFTDPAFGSAADHRELDFWGVFHVTPKGVLELMTRSKGRPNGVTLSADGRTLYVTDSDNRTLHAWDLDKNGAASNDRVLISDIPGVPGGVRADEKGNLYVAAKGVLAYSSDGKLLHMFELSEIPSNVAFGDSDFETLYITAQTSVYRVRLNVKGAVQH